MEVTRLGSSDLGASRVGLGCNNFGKRLDREATRAVIDAALEVGVTFLDTADILLIGGAMCFSFFRAQGIPTGDSLVEEEGVELARQALEKADSSNCRLRLPVDLVIGERFDASAEHRELDGVDVPDGWMGLDIGPRTAAAFADEVA